MAKKKLTIEMLIGARAKKEKFMSKEIYIESLGGTIMLQKCKYDVILGVMDSISRDSSMSNIIEIFKELIYKSVPLFRNADLLKEYEIAEPFDIVTELLELGEIVTVGNEILQMYGFDSVEEEVKN